VFEDCIDDAMMIGMGMLAEEMEERTVPDAVRDLLLFATSANAAAPCPNSSPTIPSLALFSKFLECVLKKIMRVRGRMRIRKMEEGLRICTTSDAVRPHIEILTWAWRTGLTAVSAPLRRLGL
jgi:hypothetical protein